MTTTIITITESASMPGRYTCTTKKGAGRTYTGDVKGCDPGSAAAIAMERALNAGGAYLILGPKKVMDFIPAEMRVKSA
jgi:hypothetical protein